VPGKRSAASPDTLAAAERERQAMALRLAGATYAQIGVRIGTTESSACRIVKRVLARTRELADADAESLRALEAERLDAVLLAVWPQAQKGHLGAVDRVLKIAERRAKLLGLDAPSKWAPTDPSGRSAWPVMEPAELAEWVNGLTDADG
jgi:DNA-binding CsgD family transcriptional regulator